MIHHNGTLALDTETTGLWPWRTQRRKELHLPPDMPFLFTLANTEGDKVWFRGDVDPYTRVVSYDRCRKELEWLREFVSVPSNTVAMHNAPFDVSMTAQVAVGLDWQCNIRCTRAMARVANPTEPSRFGYQGPYSLKPLSKFYLDIEDDDVKRLKAQLNRARLAAKKQGWRIATKESHGRSPNESDYWLPELRDTVIEYGLNDATRCIGLYLFYNELFDEQDNLAEINEWEQRIISRVIRIQRYGMTYLSNVGLELHDLYTRYMDKQIASIDNLGFQGLNPQSPKQLQQIFIEDDGRTTKRTTDKGNPKIDAEQLMDWARGSSMGADVDGDGPDGCKLSRAILEWKAGKKCLEYLDAYEFFKCRRLDGSWVLHPSWDPEGARTGRFSCKDPNAMQIADAETSRRHSRIRARQRECFGPRPGYYWYMPDYSQIEVWIFAFVAKEETMMRALLRGEDFHLSTARAAWGHRDDFCSCGAGKTKPRNKHSGHCLLQWWRQRAKMILFSRFFGGGVGKVAELIRCPMNQAKQFVDDFNRSLPGVPRYIDRLSNKIAREGILVNLFGREYPIERDRAYKGVNYMVQGSAAEIMKRALVRVDELFEKEMPENHVVGTVHDELVNEIHPKWHSKWLMREIIKLMQVDSHYVPGMNVPLPVGMKYTNTAWTYAKKVRLTT